MWNSKLKLKLNQNNTARQDILPFTAISPRRRGTKLALFSGQFSLLALWSHISGIPEVILLWIHVILNGPHLPS